MVYVCYGNERVVYVCYGNERFAGCCNGFNSCDGLRGDSICPDTDMDLAVGKN